MTLKFMKHSIFLWIKKSYNEVQNKMEVAIVRIEEAEERIRELEDKIVEKEEAKKKRYKNNPGSWGKI